MTGTYADIARARRIEALQAMYGDDAPLMTKKTPKALRFPPIDKIIDHLTTQDPLRLMAA